jgi:hypothetical protein
MANEIASGTLVKVGFGTATIIRSERKYRQDGYMVQDTNSQNGYGSTKSGYPRWVPESAVTLIP